MAPTVSDICHKMYSYSKRGNRPTACKKRISERNKASIDTVLVFKQQFTTCRANIVTASRYVCGVCVFCALYNLLYMALKHCAQAVNERPWLVLYGKKDTK